MNREEIRNKILKMQSELQNIQYNVTENEYYTVQNMISQLTMMLEGWEYETNNVKPIMLGNIPRTTYTSEEVAALYHTNEEQFLQELMENETPI